MIDETFNIWMLIAGLGVFLYSMHMLEQAVKELGGDMLRNIIKKYTSGTLRSISTGAVVTAILQSSSAVSLMVLAFAGAGFIDLVGAIGVIIGSNLGTTITSWVIAGLGFKFSIEAVSLPFVGIGGLGMVFIKKRKNLAKICTLIFAFGLLLLGLGFMKEATDVLAEDIDITHWGDYKLIFLLGGILLAALMQSSSAAVLIAFSGIYSGIFDWDAATHIVVGTALGTTITVFLGSITGAVLQKRIAASHFFFNLVTVALALLLIPFLNILILDWWNFREDMVIGLAVFHTTFKFIGVVLFAVFLTPYANFIRWVIKEHIPTHTRYISNITSEVPEAGIKALSDEVTLFQNMSLYFILKVFRLSVTQGVIPGFTHRYRLKEFQAMDEATRYEYLKDLQAEIYSFAFNIRSRDIKPEEDLLVRSQLQALRHFLMAVKKCKDLSTDIKKFTDSSYETVRNISTDMMKTMAYVARDLSDIMDQQEDKKAIENKLEKLDSRADDFLNTSIDQINKMVEKREIPLREQSSLLAVQNEFHQIILFFLEGMKILKQVDDQQMNPD
nr:Na/Pi cotransporter family protein [Saprospiraceae bacterium]